MTRFRMRGALLGLCCILILWSCVRDDARAAEKVVVDLDIGDDIDDAFALALILVSPEYDVVGITTTWGDTALRVRLVHRFLEAFGREGIPVAAGVATPSTTIFSQARWAQRWHGVERGAPPAVDVMLSAAASHPGEVTLLALGPLTNVASALRNDPERFRRFKRIVLMGGSLRRGYGRSQYSGSQNGGPYPPSREYNIGADVGAAQVVFASGVPIELYPLDATIVQLDDVLRRELFAHGSAVTDALTLLYYQWSGADSPWANPVPTLFDVVPVAALIDPSTCPRAPMRVVVDTDGMTREGTGAPNATVCLASDRGRVLDLMMRRLLSAP